MSLERMAYYEDKIIKVQQQFKRGLISEFERDIAIGKITHDEVQEFMASYEKGVD